jgi:hypothetical protein
MSTGSLLAEVHAVKHKRFVAKNDEAQAEREFELGRQAYRADKRRSYCFTDDMLAGWDSAFEAGRQVYAKAMLAQEVSF